MQLPNDPVMLFSYVNLKLRDYYSDLEEMCEDLDFDQAMLVEKLTNAGYVYDRDKNRFV